MSEAPWTYAEAIKDPTVEEPFNYYWHRPVAFRLIVKPLEGLKRRPTPNMLTILSGVFGVASGVSANLYSELGPSALALSALCLFISVLFDCSDGMLARLTGQSSEFGMILDGAVDFIVAMSFGLGLAVTLISEVQANWVQPAVIFTFPSMILHCAIYDQLKQRFVLLCNPPQSNQPPHQSADTVDQAPPIFIRVFKALYEIVYSGAFKLLTGVAEPAHRPNVTPEDAREVMSRSMRAATWLGLGTHFACLYIATALGFFDVRAPLFCAALLIAGLLNVWMVSVAMMWRRAERSLDRRARAITAEEV